MCHRTLTSKAENRAAERRSNLKTQLSNTGHVSVTGGLTKDEGVPWCHCSCDLRPLQRLKQLKQSVSNLRPYVTSTTLKIDRTILLVTMLPTCRRLGSSSRWPRTLAWPHPGTSANSRCYYGKSDCSFSLVIKLSKLSSPLYMNTTFKDVFDAEFEEQRDIPAAINTRWNLTLDEMKWSQFSDVIHWSSVTF